MIVIGPVPGETTEIVTLAALPEARLPRLHTTIALPTQSPWLELDEEADRPPENVSPSTRLVAADGPALVTT